MNIQLNGEHRDIPDDATVTQLLDLLAYTGRRVAVERNGAIVPKSQHAQTVLEEGDRVEIVVAVGGG